MPKEDKHICKIIFFILMQLLLVGCSENGLSTLDQRYELLVSGTPKQKVMERDYVCDLRDFNSPEFKHWGVVATTSLYCIDKEGIVNDPYETEEFKFLKQ